MRTSVLKDEGQAFDSAIPPTDSINVALAKSVKIINIIKSKKPFNIVVPSWNGIV